MNTNTIQYTYEIRASADKSLYVNRSHKDTNRTIESCFLPNNKEEYKLLLKDLYKAYIDKWGEQNE